MKDRAKRLLLFLMAMDRDHRLLRKLPMSSIIKRKAMWRHLAVIIGGACVCLVGSRLATMHDHPEWIPHFVWDAFACLLHGFGSIPILAHAEKLFALIE